MEEAQGTMKLCEQLKEERAQLQDVKVCSELIHKLFTPFLPHAVVVASLRPLPVLLAKLEVFVPPSGYYLLHKQPL